MNDEQKPGASQAGSVSKGAQPSTSGVPATTVSQTGQAPARLAEDRVIWRIRDLFSRYGIFITLVFMVVVSALLSPGFLKSNNLLILSRQASMLGIVAVGQTFVILSGGIDLSVASVMALVSVMTAHMMDGQDARVLPIAVLCLVIAAGIGLANGLLVTRFKIAPFIATLGMVLLIQGARFVYTGGAPKGSIPDAIRFWGRGLIGTIPTSVIIWILIAIIGAVILSKTVFGRRVYAVGGSVDASNFSGVNVNRVTTMAYVACSLLAGVTGLVLTGYIGLADNWLGRGYELDSIAAVVLGGASLDGGRGSVWRTVAGVLIIAVLYNIVLRLTLPEETQRIIKGVVILAAVALYQVTRRQ
jgi:ribose/xylose/arabinose/galactoside ABC-type transport system permease subunit